MHSSLDSSERSPLQSREDEENIYRPVRRTREKRHVRYRDSLQREEPGLRIRDESIL